jgi:hypothetical protein
MSQEKFSWKSLFIQDSETTSAESNVTSPLETRNEPSQKMTFPTPSIANSGVKNEVLTKILEMYEKGFSSLNQSGYDFYEYFKSVMATDPHNSQSYVMAFTMASSMDNSITKTALLSSADFYIREIHKVHAQYEAEGTKIKNDFISSKKTEKEQLQNEISSLQAKIAALQVDLEQKNAVLYNFDNSNFGKIEEIEQKLLANNMSKDRIIQQITHVLSGINNNI